MDSRDLLLVLAEILSEARALAREVAARAVQEQTPPPATQEAERHA